jgi:trypsin
MKTSLKGFLLLMGYQALATPPHHPYPYPPIVNGIMISISQAPYQVLLNSGANGGGAIIADRWILTAAHLSNVTGGKAGVSTRSQTGQALQIANFYKPNEFLEQLTGQTIKYNSTSNPAHDIALIKLAQPLSINGNTTGYAQLASSQNQSLWNPGQQAFVSGYGRTSINASLSEELRRANVSIISGGAAERKIHAQGPNNNDACEGDSGGPLMSNNILIGTVSSDLGGVSSQPSCGNGGKYMKVADYLEYIITTIHENSGPDAVCDNATFSNLAIIPDGCSFQWGASPASLFSVTSGTGLSFTTSKNGTNSGNGVISLTVTTPQGTFTATKSVWVGRPGTISHTTDGTFSISPYSYSTTICRNLGYCMKATSEKATSFDYAWFPTANNSFLNKSTVSVLNDYVCFGTSQPAGTYALNTYAFNACGSNSRSLVVNVVNCGYRVSPNPAQKQLSVDFDAPEHPESIPDVVELKGETSTKPLRSVALSQQKAGGQAASSLTMDVGDLPRGVYYLHLTFGAKQERVRVILN